MMRKSTSSWLRRSLWLWIGLFAWPVLAAVEAVGPIGLTVDHLQRELDFFVDVLSFQQVSTSTSSGAAPDELLNLPDAKVHVAVLKLGDELVTLTQHDSRGRAIPADSQSNDHWFQHIAIVVRDMDLAYEHLRRQKVRHVSTRPQTLPAWNKNAAGIKAFYFRDPEDHVLEIIWFPPGKGDKKWQQKSDRLFLGIDHTAIVVSDTDQSLAFYRDALGLRVAGESENYGTEQEHLNQLFGARLRITGLRAQAGPGIEFLEYITPPGGRPLPGSSRPNDLVFWRTYLTVPNLQSIAARLQDRKATFVSRLQAGKPNTRIIVRDPDGHALQLDEQVSPATVSAQR